MGRYLDAGADLLAEGVKFLRHGSPEVVELVRVDADVAVGLPVVVDLVNMNVRMEVIRVVSVSRPTTKCIMHRAFSYSSQVVLHDPCRHLFGQLLSPFPATVRTTGMLITRQINMLTLTMLPKGGLRRRRCASHARRLPGTASVPRHRGRERH